MHTTTLSDASLVEYVPIGQLVQLEVPALVYDPAVHAVHVSGFRAVFP